jgi:hypothetical protein
MQWSTDSLLWVLCCGLCCVGVGLATLVLFLYPLTSILGRRVRTEVVDVDYTVRDAESVGDLPDGRRQ